LEPLEAQTREVGDDQELLAFRAALAAIYAAYATALIELEENVRRFSLRKCREYANKQAEAPENVRQEAESLLNVSVPLLLRFLSDRNHEVPLTVSTMVADLLRTVSQLQKPGRCTS
jgi:exportin-T